MVFHEASEEIALRHSGKQFKTSLLSRVKKILHSKRTIQTFWLLYCAIVTAAGKTPKLINPHYNRKFRNGKQ
jgi:hypothetical protein